MPVFSRFFEPPNFDRAARFWGWDFRRRLGGGRHLHRRAACRLGMGFLCWARGGLAGGGWGAVDCGVGAAPMGAVVSRLSGRRGGALWGLAVGRGRAVLASSLWGRRGPGAGWRRAGGGDPSGRGVATGAPLGSSFGGVGVAGVVRRAAGVGVLFGGWAGVCRVSSLLFCCTAGAIRRGGCGVLLGYRVSGDKRRCGVCQNFPGVLRPQFERVAPGWALRFLGRLGGGLPGVLSAVRRGAIRRGAGVCGGGALG